MGAVEDLDESTQLVKTFANVSSIGLAILDNRQRFQFVNHVVAAIYHGVSAETFVGTKMRDLLGDASPEPEARLRRALTCGETSSVEVRLMLPTRTEPGYWIEKNFTIKDGAGTVVQVASLAIEVTAQRKLEEYFRKLCGELLWRREGYQRLAQELHDSINEYHAALGISLDRLSRCCRNPENIPELLAQSMELEEQPMRKLAAVVSRCFPVHQH